MDMDQISQRLFQQTMDLWVLPEIDKRGREKRLPDNFTLKKAQIVFSLDRGWTKVRLNEEVRAIADVKINVPKNGDDPIRYTFGAHVVNSL